MPTDALEEKINKLITDVEVIKTQLENIVKQGELVSGYQEKRCTNNEKYVDDIEKRLKKVENVITKFTGITIGVSAVISIVFSVVTKLLYK